MSQSTNEVFSITYELLSSGALRFSVATLERGQIFAMELAPGEAMDNLITFAHTLGYEVACASGAIVSAPSPRSS